MVTIVLTWNHRYDEIRSEYVTQLLSAIVNDTNQTVSNKVSAIIDRHSRGDLEHVGDALSLLWRTANQQGGAVASSSAAQVPVSLLTAPLGSCSSNF